MRKWREEIKENTNKVNCFVDEAQPEFINTMSRTMDAFDMQMSTFGGKNKNSNKNMANFVQEKRGFIRTSNGYNNIDPFRITEMEYKQPLRGSGPAFVCNYDNKYSEKTSYAHADGRVKPQLNINTQDGQEVTDIERVSPHYNLKQSNIKFNNPEHGDNTARDDQKKADFESG